MSNAGSTSERYNASDIVESQVAQGRGDFRAIVAEDTTLTYDQLRRQVNRAGSLLRGLGVKREQRVILALGDTSVFPVMFLGALRVGAVPIPVSPFDKDENLRHFVADSYAELVVTDVEFLEHLMSALAGDELQYLACNGRGSGVIELEDGLGRQSDELDAAPTHRDDMAFWFYSSGSTGKPKGVVHLHHQIEVICENVARGVLGLSEKDIIFSTSKLFHAYGMASGLLFSLWLGATVVLMPGVAAPEAILATLRRHNPTAFFSVPSLYSAILRDGSANGAFDSVRLCVSGTAALPSATFERWRAQLGLEIIDGIGSSEMLNKYCSNRPGRIAPGTAGWPAPGCELRLVDEGGTVLRGPATGTLHVRGDSRAAFYWHDHERTKRAMVGGWFVTGDRCERRDDGAYTYVGRTDDMFRVGGLWVSPADVEAVLKEHPRVADAGVANIRLADTSRVVGYIKTVGDSGDQAFAKELQMWCEQRLLSHEQPHVVKFVDELPRTANGKLQRYRLRQWAEAGDRRNADVLKTLRKTWSDVLGKDVSARDDFFALGGDSLAASELIVAIEEEFGVELRLADLLTAPTIEELANLVSHDGEERGNVPVRVTPGQQDRPILFLAAGLGDSVLRLRWLAQPFADDVVIYGLPAWEQIASSPTVPGEAQRLASGIRAIQPSGPYWLGGYSAGGIVALEIARTLEATGEAVDGLLILDTQLDRKGSRPPGPRPTIPTLAGVSFQARIAAYARGLRSPRLAAKRIYTRSGLAEWIDERLWNSDLRRRGTVRASRRNIYLWTMQVRAIDQYRPDACQAPITLLRCPDSPDPSIEQSWSALAEGGLAVRQVDVPHQQMLEAPHATAVAVQVKAACPWHDASSDSAIATR